MFRNLHIAVIIHLPLRKPCWQFESILLLSNQDFSLEHIRFSIIFPGRGVSATGLESEASLGFVIFGKGTIELSFQLFGKMELCNEQLNNHVIFSWEDKKASLIIIDFMFGIEEDLLISIFLQTLYTSSSAKSVIPYRVFIYNLSVCHTRSAPSCQCWPYIRKIIVNVIIKVLPV